MPAATAYVPRHAQPRRLPRKYRSSARTAASSNVRVFSTQSGPAADAPDTRREVSTPHYMSPRAVTHRAIARQRRYSDGVLFDPITRVEWDAFQANGRDVTEWYDRLPGSQRHLPEGVVTADGIRFRVGVNVTVIQPTRG